MKVCLIVVCSFLTMDALYSQDQDKINAIEAEGKRLYRLEAAAWNGTEMFINKFPEKKADLGGYLSYLNEDITIFVFYSKTETPVTLATIYFDSTFSTTSAKMDLKSRKLNDTEQALVRIRSNALRTINSDTVFKTYKNTNLNLVPLINGNEKKIYVLTGPQVEGVVVFGNDYLLMFDDNDQVKSVRQLHKNIIPVNFDNKREDTVEIATIHSHLPSTGDYITPTDICTLMLYEKMAGWQNHIVMSEKYVSVWDCKRDRLAVLTLEAFKKIYSNK